MDAAKIVSDAIIGNDFRTIIVNDKPYTIYPPTIKKIAGAISCLSEIEEKEGDSVKDVFLSTLGAVRQYAKALSWMINGCDSLDTELSNGTFEEVVNGLDIAFSLISPKVFSKAVSLMKSARLLAAKQKV
ncbi:MAG: hypothetical protein WCS17_08420 [Prevotella sp.]